MRVLAERAALDAGGDGRVGADVVQGLDAGRVAGRDDEHQPVRREDLRRFDDRVLVEPLRVVGPRDRVDVGRLAVLEPRPELGRVGEDEAGVGGELLEDRAEGRVGEDRDPLVGRALGGDRVVVSRAGGGKQRRGDEEQGDALHRRESSPVSSGRACSSDRCCTKIWAAPPTSSRTAARPPSSTRSGTSRTICALAEEHGFAIAHVLETHNHADHVSGKGRLAKATGATIHVPATAGVDFPHEPLGRRRPGRGRRRHDHRARDARAPARAHRLPRRRREPGRRALARRSRATRSSSATSPGPTSRSTRRRARAACTSRCKRLLALGDFAEVWPGHIGGSLCGGAGMSEKPGTTIGFERRFNRLACEPGRGHVRPGAHGQPGAAAAELQAHRRPQPRSAAHRVRAAWTMLLPAAVQDRLEAGATLVDGRDTLRLRRRPRARLDQRDDGARRRGDPRRLGRRPRERGRRHRRHRRGGTRGWRCCSRPSASVGSRVLLAGGIASWRDAGLPVESTVGHRRRRSWPTGSARDDGPPARRPRPRRVGGGPRRGLAPRALLRPGPQACPDDLRNGGKPLAVACSVGNRSSIAVSLLRRAGVEDVVHVASTAGLPSSPDEGIELVQTG